MSYPPKPLTMDRLERVDDIIVAQSTSQCCRVCCCQPSINWVLAEGDNYVPGTNPFDISSSGWIHEESSFCGRTWSWALPGFRQVKYVQHAGEIPPSLTLENRGCGCQTSQTTIGLTEKEKELNVVAIHEKKQSCGYCLIMPRAPPIPMCNCCGLPYLESRTAEGELVGKTQYVCDGFLFVPKFDVFDADGNKKYRIRPDTCVAGCCMRCRCDGNEGKCCRVPYVIRDPNHNAPIPTEGNERFAQADVLWTGFSNALCTKKNAYHLAFPHGITAKEKIILVGSALLLDVTILEQEQ